MKEKYQISDQLIGEWKDGKLPLKPGCDMETTLEHRLNKEMSDIREMAGNFLMDTLPRTNSPLIMSLSGSKGSPLNMSQMIACVGQ